MATCRAASRPPRRSGRSPRRVIRREAPGPTVILIHESPGLSASTFAIAGELIAHGYRIVLPILLDAAWTGGGMRHQVASVVKLCVARELSALSAGRTGAIVEWLRALADEEARSTGDRPVGVIGMCFSGGFALGTITNPHIRAAVLSQPALPFLLPFRGSDLGVSKADLRAIHERTGTGAVSGPCASVATGSHRGSDTTSSARSSRTPSARRSRPTTAGCARSWRGRSNDAIDPLLRKALGRHAGIPRSPPEGPAPTPNRRRYRGPHGPSRPLAEPGGALVPC